MRISGILPFLFFAIGLQAQHRIDQVYFQLYGGINKSANENMPYSEFTLKPMAGGCFVGVGKEFTPLWGWRATLGYDRNKSRNVQECENPDTYGWNDFELFGDITFDITDAIRKQDKDYRFNLKAFAGIGGVLSSGYPQDFPLSYYYPYTIKKHGDFGMHVGLNASWKVAQGFSIGVELSHTFATDHFNGVADSRAPFDQRSNLSVGLTYTLPEEKPRTTVPVIYSNRLKEIPPISLIAPPLDVSESRYLSGSAFLDFPVDEIVIYNDYRKNSYELRKIDQSLSIVRFDNTVEIKSISLHGYASPESPYSHNTYLANGRMEALKNYIKQTYGLKNTTFYTQYTPEDWGNLRAFVADSMGIVNNSLAVYREELLSVIDLDMDPDEKEEVLKKVGNGVPYNWLYQNIYPALRHTDYRIEFTLKEYPMEEARRIIYTHPEVLSLSEIHKVAMSYPEHSEGRQEALYIAAKQYPESDIANHNAATAAIESTHLKDARKYASNIKDSADSRYLLNIIDAMEGKVKWHKEGDRIIVD